MSFAITSLYAMPIAVLAVVLSLMVSVTRGKFGVALGDGGHSDLLVAMRRHGNLTENVPFVLFLMALAEAGGATGWTLHGAGIVLLASRLIHPLRLDAEHPAAPLRVIGASGTTLVTLWLVGVLAFQHWGG